MKDKRNIICKYYICAGECEKGRDASVTRECLRCTYYTPRKHVKPFRVDRRREKIADAQRKDKD